MLGMLPPFTCVWHVPWKIWGQTRRLAGASHSAFINQEYPAVQFQMITLMDMSPSLYLKSSAREEAPGERSARCQRTPPGRASHSPKSSASNSLKSCSRRKCTQCITLQY